VKWEVDRSGGNLPNHPTGNRLPGSLLLWITVDASEILHHQFGMVKPQQNNEMFTIYQLVSRISSMDAIWISSRKSPVM
jgi:hypothetical protein